MHFQKLSYRLDGEEGANMKLSTLDYLTLLGLINEKIEGIRIEARMGAGDDFYTTQIGRYERLAVLLKEVTE